MERVIRDLLIQQKSLEDGLHGVLAAERDHALRVLMQLPENDYSFLAALDISLEFDGWLNLFILDLDRDDRTQLFSVIRNWTEKTELWRLLDIIEGWEKCMGSKDLSNPCPV